jgi:hypothetical protein
LGLSKNTSIVAYVYKNIKYLRIAFLSGTFEEGELDPGSVVAKNATTAAATVANLIQVSITL